MDVSGKPKGFDDKEHAIVLDLNGIDAPKLAATLRSHFYRVYGFEIQDNGNPATEHLSAIATIDPNFAAAQSLREVFMAATRQLNQIYPWQDFTFFTPDENLKTAALQAGWKAHTVPEGKQAAQTVLDILKIGTP
jgi:hypothetical protein